ncbi:MAG: hypothetical protein IJF90_02250 [Synergistaceae bacterium]|nr:hypothetical protein [Synergistaceae bacterium]
MKRIIRNPEITAEHWDNIRNALHNALHNARYTVEDRKDCYFAPCGRNPLKDADNVRNIFNILDKLCDLVDDICSEREKEASAYRDASISFEAWELGLCPLIMHALYNENPRNPASHDSNWEHIADFKTEKSISVQDTINALKAWFAEQRKAG